MLATEVLRYSASVLLPFFFFLGFELGFYSGYRAMSVFE
jgi:hypothetical protein